MLNLTRKLCSSYITLNQVREDKAYLINGS